MLAEAMQMKKMGKQDANCRVKLARAAKSERKRRNGEPNCLDNGFARVGKSKRWLFSKKGFMPVRVDATRKRGNDAVSGQRHDPARTRFSRDGRLLLRVSALNASFDEIDASIQIRRQENISSCIVFASKRILRLKLITSSHMKNSVWHLCSLGVYIFLEHYLHQDCGIPKNHHLRHVHVKALS